MPLRPRLSRGALGHRGAGKPLTTRCRPHISDSTTRRVATSPIRRDLPRPLDDQVRRRRAASLLRAHRRATGQAASLPTASALRQGGTVVPEHRVRLARTSSHPAAAMGSRSNTGAAVFLSRRCGDPGTSGRSGCGENEAHLPSQVVGRSTSGATDFQAHLTARRYLLRSSSPPVGGLLLLASRGRACGAMDVAPGALRHAGGHERPVPRSSGQAWLRWAFPRGAGPTSMPGDASESAR